MTPLGRRAETLPEEQMLLGLEHTASGEASEDEHASEEPTTARGTQAPWLPALAIPAPLRRQNLESPMATFSARANGPHREGCQCHLFRAALADDLSLSLSEQPISPNNEDPTGYILQESSYRYHLLRADPFLNSFEGHSS